MFISNPWLSYMIIRRLKHILPITLLLVSSCAWWGAETDINMSHSGIETEALSELIASELGISGYSVPAYSSRSNTVRTRWYGQYAYSKRKDVPTGAFRCKLRFRIKPHRQQIYVAVRYQQLWRGRISYSMGDAGDSKSYYSGSANEGSMVFENGQYTGNFASDYSPWTVTSGNGNCALWGSTQPGWILLKIDRAISRITQRLGRGCEYSWVLVNRPELTGPRYLGSFPRPKK